jgi:hypothetical protein
MPDHNGRHRRKPTPSPRSTEPRTSRNPIVNQISGDQQPITRQNAAPGWRHAADPNRYPQVDKARPLWDKARRLWSFLSHQRRVIAVAALLVIMAAVAVPTAALHADHMGGKGRSYQARYTRGSSAPAARFYANVLSYRFRPGYPVQL